MDVIVECRIVDGAGARILRGFEVRSAFTYCCTEDVLVLTLIFWQLQLSPTAN